MNTSEGILSDLSKPMTQADFGNLVGISQSAVSGLARREIIRPGDPAVVWLAAYLEHLRAMAAAREPEMLTVERTRVATATAVKLEMANAAMRREYAPAGFLDAVVRDVTAQLAARLGELVPALRRRITDLPESVVAHVAAEVAACQDVCARACLADVDRLDAEDTEDAAASTQLDANDAGIAPER